MSFGNRLLLSVIIFGIGGVLATVWYYYLTSPHGHGKAGVAITAAVLMIIGVIGMIASPIEKKR